MRSISTSLLLILVSLLSISHAFMPRRNGRLDKIARCESPFRNVVRGGHNGILGGSRSPQAANDNSKKTTLKKKVIEKKSATTKDSTARNKKWKISVDLRERKVQIGLLASLLFCYPILTMWYENISYTYTHKARSPFLGIGTERKVPVQEKIDVRGDRARVQLWPQLCGLWHKMSVLLNRL